MHSQDNDQPWTRWSHSLYFWRQLRGSLFESSRFLAAAICPSRFGRIPVDVLIGARDSALGVGGCISINFRIPLLGAALYDCRFILRKSYSLDMEHCCVFVACII